MPVARRTSGFASSTKSVCSTCLTHIETYIHIHTYTHKNECDIPCFYSAGSRFPQLVDHQLFEKAIFYSSVFSEELFEGANVFFMNEFLSKTSCFVCLLCGPGCCQIALFYAQTDTRPSLWRAVSSLVTRASQPSGNVRPLHLLLRVAVSQLRALDADEAAALSSQMVLFAVHTSASIRVHVVPFWFVR